MAEKHTHSEPSGKIWTKGELSTSFYYSCVYGINCLKVSISIPSIPRSSSTQQGHYILFVFRQKSQLEKLKKSISISIGIIYRLFKAVLEKNLSKKKFSSNNSASVMLLLSRLLLLGYNNIIHFCFWLRTRKYFLMNASTTLFYEYILYFFLDLRGKVNFTCQFNS